MKAAAGGCARNPSQPEGPCRKGAPRLCSKNRQKDAYNQRNPFKAVNVSNRRLAASLRRRTHRNTQTQIASRRCTCWLRASGDAAAAAYVAHRQRNGTVYGTSRTRKRSRGSRRTLLHGECMREKVALCKKCPILAMWCRRPADSVVFAANLACSRKT